MPSALHCPNCGSAVSGASDVCHACGHALDTEAEFEHEMVEQSNRYIAVALIVIGLLILGVLLFR